jgi:hypothetical protein
MDVPFIENEARSLLLADELCASLDRSVGWGAPGVLDSIQNARNHEFFIVRRANDPRRASIALHTTRHVKRKLKPIGRSPVDEPFAAADSFRRASVCLTSPAPTSVVYRTPRARPEVIVWHPKSAPWKIRVGAISDARPFRYQLFWHFVVPRLIGRSTRPCHCRR